MARLDIRLELGPQMSSQEHREFGFPGRRPRLLHPLGAGGRRTGLPHPVGLYRHDHPEDQAGYGDIARVRPTPMLTAMSATGLARFPKAGSSWAWELGAPPGDRARPTGWPFAAPGPAARDGDHRAPAIAGRKSHAPGPGIQPAGRGAGKERAGPAAARVHRCAGSAMLELAGEIADGVLLNWTAAERLADSGGKGAPGRSQGGSGPIGNRHSRYVRVAVGDDVAPARASLQRQIAVYAGMSYYRNSSTKPGLRTRWPRRKRRWNAGTGKQRTAPSRRRCKTRWPCGHGRAMPGLSWNAAGRWAWKYLCSALPRRPRLWVVPGNSAG